MNKKGQGLPLNTVIIAIIVIVVLVVILIFFVGGVGQVTSKIRQILTGGISGQSLQVARNDCTSLCETAKSLPDSLQRTSGYCTKAFIVDNGGKATRMACGADSRLKDLTEKEKQDLISSGVDVGSTQTLEISCNAVC
ncbi:MAG: hypothetical protein WC595_05820 [Candidatus Nanoarchaeia archaeon]